MIQAFGGLASSIGNGVYRLAVSFCTTATFNSSLLQIGPTCWNGMDRLPAHVGFLIRSDRIVYIHRVVCVVYGGEMLSKAWGTSL